MNGHLENPPEYYENEKGACDVCKQTFWDSDLDENGVCQGCLDLQDEELEAKREVGEIDIEGAVEDMNEDKRHEEKECGKPYTFRYK